MYCNKCGNQIPDGSKFCSFCGSKLDDVEPELSKPAPAAEPEYPSTSKMFEEISWNTGDYPDTNYVSKTDDIDFDWGANPDEIRDRYTRGLSTDEKIQVKIQAEEPAVPKTPDFELPKTGTQVQSPFEMPARETEKLSASDKLDKFYTFSKKNEEFQQLLNREYEKIKGGNPIKVEMDEAAASVANRFEQRLQDPSMEAFLDREGVNKPYEPKAFESDVLARIEAQEAAREEARREAEARERALEEARRKAEEERKAQEAAIAKAEEEARLAAEQAARLAAEQARIKKIEEERLAAEEEARAREAIEKARLQAESELRAAQEAAKIKAQHEARQAVIEEERIRAAKEKMAAEEALLRNRLQEEQKDLQMQANSAAAAEEVRKALAQTARMKEEEAAKIRAAVAGFKSTSAPVEAVAENPETVVAEPIPAVPVEPAPAPVEVEEAVASANLEAHRKTQDTLSAMAKARAEFLKEFGIESASQKGPEIRIEPPADKAVGKTEEAIPATVEELLGEKPVTGRDTMLNADSELVATKNINKEDILSGMERTIRISKEVLKESMTVVSAEELEGVSEADEHITDVEDLLSQFEAVTQEGEELPGGEELLEESLAEETPIEEGFAVKEEPSLLPDEAATEEEKPGLNDTMVMPAPAYVKEIAADNNGKAMDDFFGAPVGTEISEPVGSDSDATEIAAFGNERAASEPEEKSKPGAGRVVLKVLLIILIVIFAVELASIGIKFLAPNSAAAEFIDNQLNKVIHLITGQGVDYSIPGIEYRV